jgi:hypothetical protein
LFLKKNGGIASGGRLVVFFFSKSKSLSFGILKKKLYKLVSGGHLILCLQEGIAHCGFKNFTLFFFLFLFGN